MGIAAVNYESRLIVTHDGRWLPITRALDEEGDECDYEDGVWFVAGEGFEWYKFPREAFSAPRAVH